MKKIILIILICGVSKLYAQRSNDYSSNNYNNNTRTNNTNNYTTPRAAVDAYSSQVRLSDSTQEITADIMPFKGDPKIKNDRYYFWYYNKVIHSTQGGFSGQLLNGHYIAFYPDKNLKEEGTFKTGLKDGIWKTWNPKGDLTNVANWDEGVEVPMDQSLWKKIPFINRKDAQSGTSKSNGNQ